MSLGSLLAMPKKHFFWLFNMKSRVQAERDLRLLNILVTSQSSSEGYEKIAESLRKEMGVIHETIQQSPKTFTVQDENELDPEFDRAALRALKIKHGC